MFDFKPFFIKNQKNDKILKNILIKYCFMV